ncbi:hypothetical protein BDW62DRAFT_214599 [Aspergillus aurantiobrunneus]
MVCFRASPNGDTLTRIVPNSLDVYVPNKGAPIFFTVAFAISAVGHIWQCYLYKSWSKMGLHSLVAVLFTTGYALREYGTTHQTLVAPLLELSNYHIRGRIVYYIPHRAPIAPGNVLSIFGALMGIFEAINALGVAFTSNPKGDKQSLGRILILIALAIQLCVITTFLCVAGIFHHRCPNASIRARNIPALMITLYTSMVLILWFFYVFDAAVMLANSWLWNVFHPGRYLPSDRRVSLSEDGVTETVSLLSHKMTTLVVEITQRLCILHGLESSNGQRC